MTATNPAPSEDILTSEVVWAALTDVMDPELPISIVDLGLVYDVRVKDSTAELDITFTAAACPAIDFIKEDIRTRLLHEPSIDAVEINIVWDPPWTKERLSDKARAELRMFGVSV